MNLKTTASAVPVCYEEKNICVFERHGVYTRREAVARADIRLENYVKTVNIEALTMTEIIKRDIIPSVSEFVSRLCGCACAKKAVGGEIPCRAETETIKRLSSLNDEAYSLVLKLEKDLSLMDRSSVVKSASHVAEIIIPDMEKLRAVADREEEITSSQFWRMPSYSDVLYSVT